MPSITIAGTGRVIRTSAAVSILHALMREGEPIMHLGGGKAQCGTCRVRILRGEETLSPPTDYEKVKLSALKNPPRVRLACQTYTFGDVTVEIVNRPGSGPGNGRKRDE